MRYRALVVFCLLLPAAAFAPLHVRLESSTPAPGELIDSAPSQLRLRFSGRIEQRYSDVRLFAPDGGGVPTGTVTFVEGSDREFTAAVPPISVPGMYTVRWRTAGADGHVLEGSYSFALAGDPVATDTVPAPVQPAEPVHDHGHDHDHEVAMPGASVAGVAGRWLHFGALLLLLGAVAARVLLLPRLNVEPATRAALAHRAWRGIAVGGLLLGAAAVLRLWLQSTALHGVERAWSADLLSIMLTDTTWGRAWLVQVVFIALLGAGIAAARPPRDRYALFLAIPAAIGLAVIPAIQGHAAGATGLALVAVANDTLHVLAAGTWIGLLAMLLLAVLPVLRRHEEDPDFARADALARFSPLALTAAAAVAVTGVINTVTHLSAPAQLWETQYGVALLAKLAVLSLVVAVGMYNWRVVRPRLREATYARRFRLSAGFELAMAAFVLLATAVLTGLPRP
jgi:putative copper export protein/methionine-rich copper-binding protein CopC